MCEKIETFFIISKGAMNIFALHPKPRKAARWHVDTHVVKMLLETCQLLYTAHWVLFYPDLLQHKSVMKLSQAQKELEVPEYMWSAPTAYRPCHTHHPCAVWTRASSENYMWLATLGVELAREYRFRFKKTHSCEEHIQWLADNLPLTIAMGPHSPFAMAMDIEYKVSTNPIVSYRNYYRKGKAGLIKYTGRHVPHWL
jgi:hypothetical protein